MKRLLIPLLIVGVAGAFGYRHLSTAMPAPVPVQTGPLVAAVPPCSTSIHLSSWYDEHDTGTPPAYASVASRVPGLTQAQHMTHEGSPTDTGHQKVEIFRITAPHSLTPNLHLVFQVWVWGHFKGTYGIMGIEGFDQRYNYLSEVDVQFKPTAQAQLVTVNYVTPATTDHVAVYMQSPEQYKTSSLDLTLDGPALYAIHPGDCVTSQSGAVNG